MGAGAWPATPAYTEANRTGPDHAPVFTVKVQLETGQSLTAEAGSKRAAEQAAAAALLAELEAMNDRDG